MKDLQKYIWEKINSETKISLSGQNINDAHGKRKKKLLLKWIR